MPVSAGGKVAFEGKGLGYKLLIIESIMFVLPFIVIFYVFCRSDISLEFSEIIILVSTLFLILAGLILVRQIFDRFSMVATLIKKAEIGGNHLRDQGKNTDELHEIKVSFDRLMKRFKETTCELERSVFELFAIKELIEINSKTLDIDDLLSILLEKTMAVSKAQIGTVLMVEPEKHCFHVVASRGLESESKKDFYTRLYQSSAERVVSDKKAVLVQDIESDPRIWKPSDPKCEPISCLSMPIFVRENLVAILNLSHGETKQLFDSNDKRILSIMIGEMGFALENAQLHSRIQKHLKHLQEHTVELSNANYRLTQEVTERKQAEEALRKSEDKYKTLLENLPQKIFLKDKNSVYISCNENYARDLKIKPEEIAGTTDYQFYPKEVAEKYGAHDKAIIELGETVDIEEIYIHDGQKMFANIVKTPVKDEKGDTFGILGIIWDITERKQAEKEKRKLEAQIQHTQRMEAIGTLAAGIAHNFNNLLAGIMGNVALGVLDINETHPDYEILQNIKKLVQNGAKLTSQLLGYARGERYKVKPISLNKIVKETCETFGETRKDIRLHPEFAEDYCVIEADQGQIEQALLNLCVNAGDAMPAGGDLFLKTMHITENDVKGKSFYEAKPGDYVLLTLTDTGIGMDKETMEHIFDPFFTTKGFAGGTGLGLASTYTIINGHGGHIEVESEKGMGTTFSIYLQATEKEAEEETELSRELLTGKETILIVDDEEMIIQTGERALNRLGYNVLSAMSGEEALELYKKQQDEIDMVLLDMVMSGIGGGETFDRMKEINPEIKVLLSSGYAIDGEAEEILSRGCGGFIQKPFSLERLSQKIRKILDKE